MTIIGEPASVLNVVSVGLVVGLVAFITFQAMGPDDTVATGNTAEPVVGEPQLDNIYGNPLAMP